MTAVFSRRDRGLFSADLSPYILQPFGGYSLTVCCQKTCFPKQIDTVAVRLAEGLSLSSSLLRVDTIGEVGASAPPLAVGVETRIFAPPTHERAVSLDGKQHNSGGRTDALLEKVRATAVPISRHEQIELAVRLSLPAILAQLSSILMEYIDSSMVGRLGARGSAAIGLIATTTWLFWGLCAAITTGFSVQVAHHIGGRDARGARSVLRQSLLVCLAIGLAMGAVAAAVSRPLPHWLGGREEICADASRYFLVFALTLPLCMCNKLMSGMLRCSGNIKAPSLINTGMCALDVLFNFLLIFPTRTLSCAGMDILIPGAGLGVLGAALGTACSEVVAACLLGRALFIRSPHMRLLGRRNEARGWHSWLPQRAVCVRAVHIGAPIALERAVMCGAYICTTVIVAPLGVFAIAANALGVVAESLCYLPGYGISEAATTLVGQSVGAGRRDLAQAFARITVGMGVSVMAVMGVLLYVAAPLMMGIMTPVPEIIDLGTQALRIEAFAEPCFALSIVSYGVFVGAGDTLIPSCLNWGTMWVVRISLSLLLAPLMGLNGVWLAMCIELCVRGLLYLWRLCSGRWIPKKLRTTTQ